MRILLVMRGAPGSGKSTWIDSHGLRPYTLEADAFRLQVTAPAMAEDGTLGIDQKHDTVAWASLMDALEERMRQGAFTVIDATHATPDSVRKYHKLVRDYRYRAYSMTVQPDLETCLARNASRLPAMKRVPEDAVRRCHQLVETTSLGSWVTPIDDISEILDYFTADHSGYAATVVIGDVHACATALRQALSKANELALGEAADPSVTFDPRVAYVFAGDLLDRGIEPAETLDVIANHAKDENVALIEGNHDTRIRNIVYDTWADYERKADGSVRYSKAFARTLGTLRYGSDETVQGQFKEIASHLVPCLRFSQGGRTFLVTHGGLSAEPEHLALVSASQMIGGVGPYATEIDQLWEAHVSSGTIQVHGHRKTTSTPTSVCLESAVEYGGSLSWMLVRPDGSFEVHETPNATYDHTLVSPALLSDMRKPPVECHGGPTADPITNAIMADRRSVRAVPQDVHNLIALNFTRQAFRKRNWNSITCRARGLFVDAESGAVKARSYDKFFATREMPETTPAAVKQWSWPLHAYRKYNGYLGIASWMDGELVLLSKGSATSAHVGWLRDIFSRLDPCDRDAIATLSRENGCSIVFEVLSLNDRHIIDFDHDQLVVLDAIRNSYDIGGVNVDEAFSLSIIDKIPYVSGSLLRCKELVATFDGWDDYATYVQDHLHDRMSEGIVCVDRDGRMLKRKWDWYTHVKHLRGTLDFVRDYVRHGQPVPWSRIQSSQEVEFVRYVLSRSDWETIHIIDAVKAYETDTGREIR